MSATGNTILIKPYHIRAKLLSFHNKAPLPGIGSAVRMDCLVKQIMDSIYRISSITSLSNTSRMGADFNPLQIASYHKQKGNVDEAFWLVFLATHFGEDEHRTKWNHVQNVFYGLGNAPYWDWKRTSADPIGFRKWLQSNTDVLQKSGRFGNHRKYESLLDKYTGKTIQSYIEWIGGKRRHKDFIKSMQAKVGTDPHILFDALYQSMEDVWRFGRTAKFDYLCLLGKLGLVDIEPGHSYLQSATGPLSGARLLFGKGSPNILNARLSELGEHLNQPFIMQILEDAICNWNKSPDIFVSFLQP